MGVFILHSFSLFRLLKEVIMEGMIMGDWLLELLDASSTTNAWAENSL